MSYYFYNDTNMNMDELSFENFSYEREFLKRRDFIMSNSSQISVQFIKDSEKSIDRNASVEQIDKIINCLPISIDIEKGIFEFALNFVVCHNLCYKNNSESDFYPIYMDKLHELCCNLDKHNPDIQNKTLYYSVLNGAIPGQLVAFLQPYQLHPGRWKKIIDKNNLRDITLDQIATTDEFKCGRCGQRKHAYYIAQTRSADEPATVFYTCVVCKKTFTKSM